MERNKTAFNIMHNKVIPYMAHRGFKTLLKYDTPSKRWSSWFRQVPFSFYGRKGPHVSRVHCAMFFWCRGKKGELLFRNCHSRGARHAPFPEVARKKGLSMWKQTMHIPYDVAFPLQRLPWHRTWIFAARDLKGYFTGVVAPLAQEGKLTQEDHYEDMMNNAVIMSAGHHRHEKWVRQEMKTDMKNIRYLANYDPQDFEHTLPFPVYSKSGKLQRFEKVNITKG